MVKIFAVNILVKRHEPKITLDLEEGLSSLENYYYSFLYYRKDYADRRHGVFVVVAVRIEQEQLQVP